MGPDRAKVSSHEAEGKLAALLWQMGKLKVKDTVLLQAPGRGASTLSQVFPSLSVYREAVVELSGYVCAWYTQGLDFNLQPTHNLKYSGPGTV